MVGRGWSCSDSTACLNDNVFDMNMFGLGSGRLRWMVGDRDDLLEPRHTGNIIWYMYDM